MKTKYQEIKISIYEMSVSTTLQIIKAVEIDDASVNIVNGNLIDEGFMNIMKIMYSKILIFPLSF